MTSPVYEVFLYQDGTRLSELEYTRLEVSSRFLTKGRWEATVPRLPHALTWKTRIQVIRNGVPIFSGPLTNIKRHWTYAETDSRVLTGTCDMKYIANAIVSPGGSAEWYPNVTIGYDIRQGIAETIIRGYISDNIGPTALARRQQGITLETDGGRGGNVSGEGNLQNLLDFCVDLALQGSIGFYMLNKTLKFYVPQDRTGEIIFSQELDNLKEFEYEANVPEYNVVVAGSAIRTDLGRFFDDESNPELVEGDGPVETFLDSRSTPVYRLKDVAQAQLLKVAQGDLNLHIVPGAQAVANMSPYDDYYLGDLVTAVVDGEVISAMVQELGLLVTQDDVHEHATLGSFGNNSGTIKVGTLLKALSSRTRSLEASA